LETFHTLAAKSLVMIIIGLVIFYVFTPLLILHLCHRYKFVNKLGAVIVAYLVGLLIGNIGLLPSFSPMLNDFLLTNPETTAKQIEAMHASGEVGATDVLAFKIYSLRDMLMSVTILLAIPLLLFSANISQWKNLAGKTVTSVLIGFMSVVLVVVIGFFIFKLEGTKDLWKVAGLLIGVYTGGTPNLASLKMMLEVDANTYILTHTYDLVVGVLYLAFLMTVGQRMFHKFLPKFPISTNEDFGDKHFGDDPFWGILKREKLVPLLKAFGIAIAIFAVGGALSLLVPKSRVMVVVILTVTTLSILASLIPSVNRIDKTFESGMYLILIFSLVVASMADIRNFAGLTPGLFGYISLAVFGSLFLQVILAKLFKVDADTTMITSVAFICSPPFVPVVAGALKNRHIIVSGITIGIIGYAVGNYLGYIVAEVLSKL
jgi:uncharacterized membrane protein